jgi:endogenous inhibitor of DNA gyrase (YacG/DUF329 family)
MKILTPEISYVYNCQICGRCFETQEARIIVEKISPVCSPECQLLVLGKVLGEYSNPELKEMISVALPGYVTKKRCEAINKLALWFLKKYSFNSGMLPSLEVKRW